MMTYQTRLTWALPIFRYYPSPPPPPFPPLKSDEVQSSYRTTFCIEPLVATAFFSTLELTELEKQKGTLVIGKGHLYGYVYKKTTWLCHICVTEDITFTLQMRSAVAKLNRTIMVQQRDRA